MNFTKTLHGVRVYSQGEWMALCDEQNNPILYENHEDALNEAKEIHLENGSLTSVYRKHMLAKWSPEGTTYVELELAAA